jgi:hypothetical protein
MTTRFTDLLNQVLGRRAGARSTRSDASRSAPSAAPVLINLGIDFGTSFTKVCFRDEGQEQSGIVRFGHNHETAIIPSIVYVAADGTLLMGHHAATSEGLRPIRYLKMRLADLLPVADARASEAALEAEDGLTAKALSAWYLVNVIREAKYYLALHQEERLRGREVLWSANLGVPVEHYDSPALVEFEETLRVAWAWSRSGAVLTSLPEVVSAYRAARDDAAGDANFHAIPEIAAAVQSFVSMREASPGFYLFFDIGGGTVDGVAFKFANEDGGKRVDFYSGRVAPLGLAVLANESDRADKRFELQQLVGYVVMTAKKKDTSDWRRGGAQSEIARPYFRALRPDEEMPIVVFIGGYGANDAWYCSAIEATHGEFQHRNAGIPRYHLRLAPRARDLDMGGLTDQEFVRFAIAYGLSISNGGGPEVRLPSYFGTPDGPPEPLRPNVIPYADSKDIYD